MYDLVPYELALIIIGGSSIICGLLGGLIGYRVGRDNSNSRST